MRTTLPALLSLILCIAGLLTDPAYGQAPQTVPSARPLLGRLTEDAESTRWLWGTFRVGPSLGIGNLGYVDDVFADSDVAQSDAQADFNVSLFAGLNIYQLLGDHAALGFFIKPEYVWWQDLEDRRRLNLATGAALALDLNRFFFNGEVSRVEDQSIVTEEAEQFINARRDLVEIVAGVPIYRSLAFAFTYRREETENLLDEDPSGLIPDFGRLDATTETTIAGIQLEPGRNTTIRLGYGELDSTADNISRDFEGDGPVLEITVNQTALSVVVSLQDFDYKPVGASNFQPYNDLSGSFAVTFAGTTGRSLTFLADRRITPSIRSGFDDFESTRISLRSAFPIGPRTSLQVGYMLGDRDFRRSDRTDDTQSVSAGLQFKLAGATSLTFRYEHSEIDSSNSSFDRNLDRIAVGLSVGLSGLSWP